MTGALEPRQDGILLGRLLTSIRVFRDLRSRQHQVAGGVREVPRGAPQMGADQTDRVEAVGIVIDDDPLVDDHRSRAHRVGARRVGLESGRVLVGRIGIEPLDALVERDEDRDREAGPAGHRQEAAPRHLAAVFDQTSKIGSHYTKGLWAGGVRMVAKMTVDAMMMMKSAATSRQPKSALIAAITPRTQSRITKPRGAKHRVSALRRQ